MFKTIQEALENKADAKNLAQAFLYEYFNDKEIEYPINPFQMLKDCGVLFQFRPFTKNLEGVYIPAENTEDCALVGINLKRPIQRQRYTAAHELCHHIKDAQNEQLCLTPKNTNQKSRIEKYADCFASELLMPYHAFKKEANRYAKNGVISNGDDVLQIAQYFGVSYQACLYRLRGIGFRDTPSLENYKIIVGKEKLQLHDTILYKQLLDSLDGWLSIEPKEFARKKFEYEYVYNDSRMEGIQASQEDVSEIIGSMKMNQDVKDVIGENSDFAQVAGLSSVYDYVFNPCESISAYNLKELNKLLFSYMENPDAGGCYRTTDAIITNAGRQPVSAAEIIREMYYLNKETETLLNDQKSLSSYLENAINIHYHATWIHPFVDGNGRTCRAFFNLLMIHRNLPPVFFRKNEKDQYKKCLKIADQKNSFDELYCLFARAILESFATITENHIGLF